MAHIKSRKHAIPRAKSPQPLTAATLLTTLALGVPATAAAQVASGPSPDAQATTLDKVDVQGHRIKRYSAERSSSPKFTQPLVDTPQTLNIIGSDLFNEQGATTLTEALRNSPGVGTFYVGENGNTSTGDAVYMRGFDSSSSIFVDGVRDLGSVSRDVFNIEQVEVAKGPAGSDNGRSAPTGAINLVTKQPFLQDRNAASLSIGSDDQRRATADFNQALGGGSALRVNLMAQDSGVPGRDEVTRKRWGIAPSVAFGLETATRVYVDLLHVDQDNVPDGGVPTIGLPGYATPDPARPQIGVAPRVDSSNFYGTTSDHDDVVSDMFTIRVEHDFGDDLRLQNTSRWGRNRQDYLLTSFMASQDPARFSTPDLDDPSTWEVARSLPTFKDQENAIATNQTNLGAHFGTGAVQHDLSTGIELTREWLQSTGIAALNGTAWPAANLYDPDPHVTGLQWGPTGASAKGRTDTAAVYAFDTMKFGERWQATGGVRLDHYKASFSSLVACGGRGGPACGDLPPGTILPGVDDSSSDTLFNWKLGVVFKPADNGSVYANYAISQQPPGGASLELSASPNNANNPIFDPQKAETAEVGTKWELFDDDLLLTAALYDTRVENEIVQDPVDQQYYQNGEKRVRGVELGAVGRITEAWSVSAGFTTMDTDVVSGPAVTNDGSSVLAYTPDKAGTVWTTYAFPFGLTLGGGVRYSGRMKRGTDGAPGTPEFTKSYTVWDLVASYAVTERFDLQLNANNLFDKDYVAAINKSGYRYTPGAPRSLLLTANFRF
ncbi:MAG TPA: catecholate siderophore receptor Fiu [Luteimonas sp.]|nr:catecholate siderophore receptor Fiu [Luteimonas sp.]